MFKKEEIMVDKSQKYEQFSPPYSTKPKEFHTNRIRLSKKKYEIWGQFRFKSKPFGQV